MLCARGFSLSAALCFFSRCGRALPPSLRFASLRSRALSLALWCAHGRFELGAYVCATVAVARVATPYYLRTAQRSQRAQLLGASYQLLELELVTL